MQSNDNEKIGIREFSTMLLLIIGVKLSDTTPVLLFQRAKNAGWILPIIAYIVIMPSFIILLSLLKKYATKDLSEIIYHLMGKYIGFFYNFGIFTIFMILSIISTRDVMDTITTMFYVETPPIILYLIFMSAAVFLCRRGLEVIGGTCWIVVPALIAAASTAVLLTLPDMNFQFIFPIGGIKTTELLAGIPFYSSMQSEVIAIAILFTRVRSYEEYAKGSFIALTIGMILISVSCLAYLLVFDVLPLEHIPFPFLELTRIIRIGRFISNAEALFFTFWIMAACLRYTIYMYVVTKWLLNTFHKDNLEPFFKFTASIVIFFSLLPENYVTLVFKVRRYLLLSSFLILIPLPYILLLLSKRKGANSK